MAYNHYLILIVSLIVVGCAEVGIISGGSKDEIAPKIVKSSIQNGTTNFDQQSVEFTFDEFVQLNKPTENIFIVPQHAKPETQLVKKTLKISLSNELKKNTTYTLYLNAAVKDVTEGNDSLMQFTFSTGSKLDSLKFSVRTLDAFSNQVKSKVTVGLFDSINAEKPIYFGQTNQQGLVTLTAIKEGIYFCKAFEDKNKDLKIQLDESQDWNFEPIQISGNLKDSLPMKLSTPLQSDKFKNAKLLPPGLIALHVPKAIEINKILLNEENLTNGKHWWRTSDDSLQISAGNRTENEIRLVINSDTFNVRRTEKNKLMKLNPKNITDEKEISNVSQFEVMDFIESLDTAKINLFKLTDSSKVNYTVNFSQNKIQIQPIDKSVRKYTIVFKEGAIDGRSGKKNILSKSDVISKEEREFGSLIVKCNKLIEHGILQLLDNEKIIDEQKLSSQKNPITFNRLTPGEYTFRIIDDVNQNGQWDPISPAKRAKAERVFQFSTPVKVRANWEVETILELKDL
jgi:hypothetical protein